ncbi:hypothetical protein VXT26_08620 [Pseudomonas aeruginosa]|uniref:hypothetical protein n=1 Tax=Pseudomonas aeruginosa TaxID=287 RepID=UPI001CD80F2C|nr:hypothetical protein [Pseudomonas aeruginosa]MEC6339001.1 hypothetical protein [Pseudomonas aeruginosa]
MNKANECTCPSGNGSLRHPCPAHPDSVELAGVAAKLTFINGRPAMCGCQVEYSSGGGEYSDVIDVTLCAKHSGSAILDLVATNRIALTPEYEGQWHADLYLDREIPLAKAEGATPAEAVLALMSAERIDPEQGGVDQAGGDRWDALQSIMEWTAAENIPDDRKLCLIRNAARAALAQPSPAQAEKAEVERPEVVGQLVTWPTGQRYVGRVRERKGCKTEDVMTVAQHERIVGELRTEIAMLRSYESEWELLLNEHEQQRDAALARVAELELKLDQSDYAYDNDRHHMRGMAKQAAEAIQVFTGHDSGANLAHRYGEKWWEHLDELRDALLAFAKNAPPAQAQHSVPEEFSFEYRHPNGECHTVTVSREQVINEMPDFLFEALCSKFCNCEPVGETNVVECCCDEYAEEFKLIAAAPGTEVPQAWLDVQAERRRQITAEGWTPYHDDLYCAAELPRAAAAYILSGANDEAPAIWPFVAKWWKPRDARANYVRAGALILAEIERLDRAAAPGKEGV